MRVTFPLVLTILSLVSFVLFLFAKSIWHPLSFEEKMEKLRESRDCIRNDVKNMNVEQFWNSIVETVNRCSQLGYLEYKKYANLDETKIHLPSQQEIFDQRECTVVTLGVGHDIRAEQKLKKDFPACSFFGADPTKEINEPMYQEIGKFFNTAVGGHSGDFQARVMTSVYLDKTVPFKQFYQFLEEDVQRKRVDQALIDIEGAEYDLLPLLLKANRPEGYTICQINIEIHRDSLQRKTVFRDFFLDMIAENEFVPLKTDTLGGHIRLYLFNYADVHCQSRYLVSDVD